MYWTIEDVYNSTVEVIECKNKRDVYIYAMNRHGYGREHTNLARLNTLSDKELEDEILELAPAARGCDGIFVEEACQIVNLDPHPSHQLSILSRAVLALSDRLVVNLIDIVLSYVYLI